MLKPTRYWAALCWAIGLLAAPGLTVPPPAAAPNPVAARPYRGTNVCTYDRIMAGPDGTQFATWPNDGRYILGLRGRIPPSAVIVGRMHDPARSAADRFHAYAGGGRRLFPIRWSADGGRLYVRLREREQRILSFDADGGAAGDAGPLDPRWRLFDINAVSHGGIAALGDPAALARAGRVDGTDLIRGSATLGAGVELLGARRADLDLVRIGAGAVAPAGINATQTRMLFAFPDARDFDGGVAYLGAPARGGEEFIPYQLPLPDLATGEVAGRFGADRIVLRRPGTLAGALAEFHRRRARAGALVLDASLSGDTLFVLALLGRNDRRIYRIGARGVSERPLCTRFASEGRPGRVAGPLPLANADTAFRPSLRAVAIDDAGRETVGAGRPILMVHQIGARPAPEAVIYFHGGPPASRVDDYKSDMVERLIEPGRDMISAEYSGTIGGGAALTRRLAARGMAAIVEDVDAIARWLERRGYRRVYVIGQSFGGVPTLVAVARHRRLFAAAFFIAPLLRVQNPEEWARTGSGLQATAADTQRASERSWYGSDDNRARFAAALQALIADGGLSAADRFYFGGRDALSLPAHLPAGVPSARYVNPRLFHADIAADEAVWRDILAHLR